MQDGKRKKRLLKQGINLSISYCVIVVFMFAALLLLSVLLDTYITTELHLSESTINTHVKAIYRKLDIHSRQDLLDIIHAQKA